MVHYHDEFYAGFDEHLRKPFSMKAPVSVLGSVSG
jgi:hypothetical protein